MLSFVSVSSFYTRYASEKALVNRVREETGIRRALIIENLSEYLTQDILSLIHI